MSEARRPLIIEVVPSRRVKCPACLQVRHVNESQLIRDYGFHQCQCGHEHRVFSLTAAQRIQRQKMIFS